MPEAQNRSELTTAALLLELLELFRERGVDRLPTEEIVAALGERLGRTITAHRLARTLKPLGVAPRQFRLHGRQRWGYLLADVTESRDAALSLESQSAGPSAESRNAAPPAGRRDADRAGAEQEWATRLAMARLGR
jgi:hypothetical protein